MANEVVKSKVIRSELQQMQDDYLPLIDDALKVTGDKYDDYSKQCVLAAMSGIWSVIHAGSIAVNDINSSNIKMLLQDVAARRINPLNNECYFKLQKKWNKDLKQYDYSVEMGIQADGYDTLLSRFGDNVEKVHPYWLVREKDHFTYPKHFGIEVTPPEWEPVADGGKVVRVVYPIEYKDGHVEYHIAERSDVVKNLAAHINQNLQNELFGIPAKATYFRDATPDEQKAITAKRNELKEKIKQLGTVEAIIADPELSKYISPSWREYHSSESMIIRKMRNNVTKKIPKDYSSVYKLMAPDAYIEKDSDEGNIVADVEYKEVKTAPKQFNQAVKVVADKTQQTAQPDTAAPY